MYNHILNISVAKLTIQHKFLMFLFFGGGLPWSWEINVSYVCLGILWLYVSIYIILSFYINLVGILNVVTEGKMAELNGRRIVELSFFTLSFQSSSHSHVYWGFSLQLWHRIYIVVGNVYSSIIKSVCKA